MVMVGINLDIHCKRCSYEGLWQRLCATKDVKLGAWQMAQMRMQLPAQTGVEVRNPAAGFRTECILQALTHRPLSSSFWGITL